jgi:AcrR family transcriptional regulator
MSPAPASARRPGRPPSDAPERILDAAYAVLKRDGYAGLTTAKVAAASGHNKALIAYYFGSKQGLVAAVARRVADTIVTTVLEVLGEPRSAAELVEGLAEGVWRLMDEDEGLQRVYFDLASQSIVEPQVSAIMIELKEGFRAVLRELMRGIDDGPGPERLDAAAVFLIAGMEGLSLERLDRGETAELSGARELYVRTATQAISGRR